MSYGLARHHGAELPVLLEKYGDPICDYIKWLRICIFHFIYVWSDRIVRPSFSCLTPAQLEALLSFSVCGCVHRLFALLQKRTGLHLEVMKALFRGHCVIIKISIHIHVYHLIIWRHNREILEILKVVSSSLLIFSRFRLHNLNSILAVTNKAQNITSAPLFRQRALIRIRFCLRLIIFILN